MAARRSRRDHGRLPRPDRRAGQGRPRVGGAGPSRHRGRRSLPGRSHWSPAIRTDDGRVRAVVTDRGEIQADIVVCAAGIWGPRIGAMVGMTVPLQPLAHQYTRTTPLPEVAAFAIPPDREDVHPIVRVQDRDLYFREHLDRLGGRRLRPRPDAHRRIARSCSAERSAGHAVRPRVHARDVRRDPGDGHRRSCRPCASPGSRSSRGINGIFSFTTDGAPLMGESPDVNGLLAGRGRVGHPRLRRRPGDGGVAGRRRIAHGPPRSRREPVRGASAGAVLHPRPRRPELHRGLRHHPSAPADGGAPAAADLAVLRARAGAWGLLPRGRTAGSGRTGTGRTRGSWARYDIPRRNAWAAALLAPHRGRRGAGHARYGAGCTT